MDTTNAEETILATERRALDRWSAGSPRVQLFEDIGILTYRYVPTMPDGETGTLWKATTVYHLSGDDWRLVHAHWSLVKAA